jgi:histidinol-phosphatase (PHP family)
MHKNATGIKADYHVHTAYCGHATGKTADYVESAIKAGLNEIAFSDHLGRYYLTKAQKRRYWDWGMNQRNIGRYISECADMAEIYKDDISVKTGLEIDFIEGGEDLLKSFLYLYPLDFMLGSIHCLPELSWKHLSNLDGKDTWPVYNKYFEAFEAAAASGLFDSIAHMDFIWRYVKWPAARSAEIFKMIDSAVAAAVKANSAIEINANGFLWSQLYKIDDGDPFETLLNSVSRHSACITIGSDAHKPEFVAKAFDALAPVLVRHGITKHCVFTERKRSFLRIAQTR